MQQQGSTHVRIPEAIIVEAFPRSIDVVLADNISLQHEHSGDVAVTQVS